MASSNVECNVSQHSDLSPTVGIFDDPWYAGIAHDRRHAYQTARPFPHIVIDDLLAEPLCGALLRYLPERPGRDWISRRSDNNSRSYEHNESKLPVFVRALIREFAGREFLLFLETMTGIDALIPDPYLLGGGLQYAGRGDYLKIHADWNWHHKLQLNRRVNALLYLTPAWDEDWGGHLELWDRNTDGAVVKIAPCFNRLVVFATGANTHHGHPEPLRCPPGTWRRALNLYYYTATSGDDDPDPGFTRYRVTESPLAMSIAEQYRAKGSRVARGPMKASDG